MNNKEIRQRLDNILNSMDKETLCAYYKIKEHNQDDIFELSLSERCIENMIKLGILSVEDDVYVLGALDATMWMQDMHAQSARL